MLFLGQWATLGSAATTEMALVRQGWVWSMDADGQWVWVPVVRGDAIVEFGHDGTTERGDDA